MAMMCRAWLSWRSPPRCEPVAVALRRRSTGSARCRSGARSWRRWRSVRRRRCGRSRQRAVRAPQPVSASSCGRCARDEGAQLALERVGVGGVRSRSWATARARRGHERGGAAAQPSLDASRAARSGRASRGRAESLELGAELEQMPAQPVLHAGALGDEVVAVIRRAAGSPSRARSRYAAGKRSTPSLTTARATRARRSGRTCPARARRAARRPSECGATRTTRSPAAISACSRRRETCRQSSIAHTRSPSSPRAQRTAARCPASSAAIVALADARAGRPRRRPPARACACGCPLRSRSSLSRPFVELSTDDAADLPADTPSVGAMPRSYQVTPTILGRRRATERT